MVQHNDRIASSINKASGRPPPIRRTSASRPTSTVVLTRTRLMPTIMAGNPDAQWRRGVFQAVMTSISWWIVALLGVLRPLRPRRLAADQNCCVS